MKKIILLGIILLSCNTPYKFSDIKNFKKSYNYGCDTFMIINGLMFFQINLNDQSSWIQFDSGNNFHILNLSTERKNEDYYSKKIQLPDSFQTIQYIKYTPHLSSKLFQINNPIGAEIFNPNNNTNICQEKEDNISLGLPLIYNLNDYQYIEFKFSSNTLCFHNELNSNLDNFIELDTYSKNNKLYVYITTLGKKYRFLFDTGNDGYPILGSENFNYEDLKIEPDSELVGNLFQNAVSGINATVKIFNINIFEEFIYTKNKYPVIYTESIKENNLGMKFIREFDWIFAKKENKVYLKPIKHEHNSKDFKIKQFGFLFIDDSFRFTFKETKNELIELNKPVESINGMNLYDKPVCETVEYINTLNIEDLIDIKYKK